MVEREIYLARVAESLAGAEGEYANGRYNNCANRCYYASFQAAVVALDIAGITPRRSRATWSHEAAQAGFVGELVNRRKLSASGLRDVLLCNQALRNTADYESHWVTEVQAARALVEAVQARGGGGA